MSSRKSRAKRKRRSSRINTPLSSTPEPKFIETCKQLLNQLTAMDDSKPFHSILSSNDALYKEYKIINSSPISFGTIHGRLHKQPCHYSNYSEFNEDIKKIFYQEKRLKNFKGNNNNIIKKRIQKAKRVENYWNTLTASFEQYGFDTINKNKNTNKSDDSKEEETPKKKRANIKQKKNKKVLSNIKKRVQKSELESQANKKRKLNDNTAELISNNRNRNIKVSDEEKDDKKQENDIYYGTDSPYTPFAEKSRVFNSIIGNSDELFKELKVKKQLDFGGTNRNVNSDSRRPMHTFEIKWKYENSNQVQLYQIESDRMDNAVKEFYKYHKDNKVKIVTVKLTRHGWVYN